jgi:Domain of unknown function (DUF4431)
MTAQPHLAGHERGVMKTMLMAIVTLMVLASPAVAENNPCLQYDKPVTLTGRLSSHKTDYRGEAKDFRYIVLTLDTSICVAGAGGLSDDDTEYNVHAMHVIDLTCTDQSQRTWTRGARVKISGELFHAHTIYHQTRILISANQIKRLDGPTPACKGLR